MNNGLHSSPPTRHATTSAPFPVWLQRNLTLQGRRITLTPLKSKHTQKLWPMINTPEILNADFWAYLHTPPWQCYEDLERVVLSRQTCQDGVFYAIIESRTSQPHGWIGLRHVDLAIGKGELGIFLPSPAVQRTIVSTEAVWLLLEYAFDHLAFRVVKWSTDARNEASRRAAERIGFVLDADEGRHSAWDGEIDMISYSLCRTEWPLAKEALRVWLSPRNFDEGGVQYRRLGDVRVNISRLRQAQRVALG